jgi:hypothetical protein
MADEMDLPSQGLAFDDIVAIRQLIFRYPALIDAGD